MNRKIIGRFGLSVMIAVMLVTSMFAPFMGAMASIGVTDDSTNKQIIGEAQAVGGLTCDSPAIWAVPAAAGYCVADSVLNPEDAESTIELEDGTFVQHGSMSEAKFAAQSDYDKFMSGTDQTESLAVVAFAEGEGAIIEERYNDNPKSEAEFEARAAAADEYSRSYKALLGDSANPEYQGLHNNLWNDFTTWSSAVYENGNADQVMYVEFTADDQPENERIAVTATNESEITYTEKELPSGETVEVIKHISDVKVIDSKTNSKYSSNFFQANDGTFGGTDQYERFDLRFAVDSDGASKINSNFDTSPAASYAYLMAYDNADDGITEYDAVLDDDDSATSSANAYGVYITAEDPNSSEISEITMVNGDGDASTVDNPFEMITSLENDRNSVNTDLANRVDEIYSQIGAGEVSPSDYWGPTKFYEEYGGAMGQSVAADLYFSQHLGADITDPESQMVVTHPSQNGEEYEGGIVLTGSQAPLVYDSNITPINSNGDISLQSPSHTGAYEADDSGNITIEFSNSSDYSDSNVYVEAVNADVNNISRDNGTITATVPQDSVQDEFGVIFEAYVEDADGNEVDRSSTYVAFSDSNTTDVRGFVVGEEYDTTVDMIYLQGNGETARTTLDSTWSFDANYGVDGNEQAVAVVQEGVDRDFSGTSVQERNEQQQTVKEATENNDNITVNQGPIISVGGDGGLFGGDGLIGDLIPDLNWSFVLLLGGLVMFGVPIVLGIAWILFTRFTPIGRMIRKLL